MSTIHGGNIIATARELGCRPDDLIDMSSNISPLGFPPGLTEELTARFNEIAYLPETSSETLVESFASRHDISPATILAGNGTTEFIFALPRALVNHVQRGLIITPTYGDYQNACDWAELDADLFPLRPEEDFELNLPRLEAELTGGELVFLCNPNNPTGRLVYSTDLYETILRNPATIFLVDESYLPFVRDPSLLSLPRPDNLCLLISFSKIYNIPGLRLGFLIAGPDIMAKIMGRRKPWGVNRMAQIAGEFILNNGAEHVDRAADYIATQRPELANAMAALPGIKVFPGEANFILSRLEQGLTAEELRLEMLTQKIMIRNCANITGLDESYFRVSLKTEEEHARYLSSLTHFVQTRTP